jgi:hypothetical protein
MATLLEICPIFGSDDMHKGSGNSRPSAGHPCKSSFQVPQVLSQTPQSMHFRVGGAASNIRCRRERIINNKILLSVVGVFHRTSLMQARRWSTLPKYFLMPSINAAVNDS